MEKACLSSLASRIRSGKVCCNCEIVNPENIPTKVNLALSWSSAFSALEMCKKTVLNKGSISGLIFFGKGLGFELGNCSWKRHTILLLAPGSALEKFAAPVNPENKPTKVNWTLSWPSALEIC